PPLPGRGPPGAPAGQGGGSAGDPAPPARPQAGARAGRRAGEDPRQRAGAAREASRLTLIQESPPRLDPRRTPLVAVAAAGFLVALKATGAWLTGSLALGSAALDSLIDLFVSGANFLVLRRSLLPPDAEHGHGKFENLAVLGQGLFLVAAAAGLVWSGVRRLMEGGAPRETGWGIAVLAVSLAVSLGVARILARAAERSGSPALKADSLHYATDLWVNGAALGALLAVRWTGWSPADPLVALAVAAYVFRVGSS